MTTTRRTLLHTTALVAPFALAACAGMTLSQLAQYAVAVGNAAQDVLGNIPPTSTTATITNLVSIVTTAANAVAGGTASSGTVSWAQQLYDGAKALLPVVAPLLSVIPGVGLGLAAIQVLMPLIASSAGLVGAAPVPVVRGLPAMSVDQALRLYGKP